MHRSLALAVAALAAFVVAVSPAAPAGADGSFFVGFTEDLPKEIGAAAVRPGTDLGASAFRITLMWTPGQTQLLADDATRLDRAVSGAGGTRLVLAVYADAGAKAPLDATAREQYCTYARNALARAGTIRDVVIWNEPNKSFFWSPQTAADGSSIAPAAYGALLARCWDVLHAWRSDVNVIGLALSSTGNDNAGSHSPGNFIRLLGDAYRASGRTKPILDTVGYHPYGADAAERPWRKHIASKTLAMGDWNKLMYNLWLAFDGSAQAVPGQRGVSIWYLEVGFQTALDPGKEAAYTGTENVKTIPAYAGGEPSSPAPAETTAAPDQHTQVLDAIRLAACQPYVGAVFNFLLFDEPRLAGWQSGAYWADRTPKPSLGAFQQTIGEARTGAVDCGALKGGRPSGDFMPPSAPTSLAGEALRDPLRVQLTWSAASDDASGITYRVYRNGAHTGTTTATTWTNVAVTGGQTYTYTVRALDDAGNLGEASAPAVVTTPDTTPPTAPTALSAIPQTNPGRVELSWTASSDNAGVAGYDVYRDGLHLGSTTATQLTDASVAGRTTYAYSVVAFDAAGNRSGASGVSVTTPDLAPPTAPGALSGRGYGDRVELTWAAAADDTGVAAYEVLRNGLVVAALAADAFAYSDLGVRQGVTYTYAVRARDAAGNVGPGASVAVAVPDTVAPSVPATPSASALSSPLRVALTWSASTDNVRVTGYRVYRNGILLASVAGTSYTDASVAGSTTYRYTISALDAAGNGSAQSAPKSVTTKKR